MPELRLPEGNVYYERAGAGSPALVWIHGAMCDHEDWREQFGHFAGRHTVIAPDLAGHGKSYAAPGRINVDAFASDVVRLVRELGICNAVLIGHSMGCRVVLEAQHLAPEIVRGLVMVDCAYLSPGVLHGKPAAEIAAIAQATRARLAAVYASDEGHAGRVRDGFAQMFFDSRFDAEREAMERRGAAREPWIHRELMPGFAAWDVMNIEPRLAALKVPMLAFASTWMNPGHRRVSLQPGMSTPWLDALRLHAPHAEISLHHGAGHFVMLEKPAEVNTQIEAFLQRHKLVG